MHGANREIALRTSFNQSPVIMGARKKNMATLDL